MKKEPCPSCGGDDKCACACGPEPKPVMTAAGQDNPNVCATCDDPLDQGDHSHEEEKPAEPAAKPAPEATPEEPKAPAEPEAPGEQQGA